MRKRHFFYFLTLLMSLGTTANAEGVYHYTMGWDNPASHQYQISLTTEAEKSQPYTDFQIPAWRPGRYILQDYAAGVSSFAAKSQDGKALQWHKTDNNTWRVTNPDAGNITISYDFYANVMDAGSSVLNREMAYFNGANLFMHVRDRYDASCNLKVTSMPADWKIGSALHKTGVHNEFRADSYHDLVDAPTIISPNLLTLETEINKVKYYLHFQGEFRGGEETQQSILENVEKIIREQEAIFGEVPMEEYHFLYLLLPYNMRHAVEHKYSACFTLPDATCNSAESASGMYGITSHEFFHLWNVKRIRPAALWPYDYQQEAYTTLHWFTEGVTEYYTNLALVRAGVIDQEKYFSIISRSFARLDNAFANSQISPSQSSFDSWLARSNYSNPHLRTSYYPLGERVGMFLDLKLRADSEGKVTLDDVFAHLYQEKYKKNEGVAEDGIQKACEKLTGMSYEQFFQDHVHGTKAYDYDAALRPYGLFVFKQPVENPGWGAIGLSRTEKLEFGLYIKAVEPGSPAAIAGLSDGDVLLNVDGEAAHSLDPDEYFANLKDGAEINCKIFAAGAEMPVKVKFDKAAIPFSYKITWRKKKLKKEEQQLLDAWLGSRAGK